MFLQCLLSQSTGSLSICQTSVGKAYNQILSSPIISQSVRQRYKERSESFRKIRTLLIFRKLAGLCWAVGAKLLNLYLKTIRHQWKDKIHIFHLTPFSTLCDQWFGYNSLLKSSQAIVQLKNYQLFSFTPYLMNLLNRPK